MNYAPLLGWQHPVRKIILQNQSHAKSCYDEAVDLAFLNGHGDWAHRLASRLRSPDFDTAASALGELRAFGALREVGIALSPLPSGNRPTPDFAFVDNEGNPIIVEVAAKFQDAAQTTLQRQVERGGSAPGVHTFAREATGWNASVTIVPIEPGGPTRSRLISRIASVKQSEAQVKTGSPAILWVDFSNFGPSPEFSLLPDDAAPIMSVKDRLTSGALWHAFYGWDGAPIFNGQPRLLPRLGDERQDHCGRFDPQAKSKFSAAVLALSDCYILFENPVAKFPLSDRVRGLMIRISSLDLTRSLCEWRVGETMKSIESGRNLVAAVQKYLNSESDRASAPVEGVDVASE